jgi:hypothetical protein
MGAKTSTGERIEDAPSKGPRGGRRPGAGRKAQHGEPRTSALSVKLSASDLAQLAEAARADGVAPGAWARRALRSALGLPEEGAELAEVCPPAPLPSADADE